MKIKSTAVVLVALSVASVLAKAAGFLGFFQG